MYKTYANSRLAALVASVSAAAIGASVAAAQQAAAGQLTNEQADLLFLEKVAQQLDHIDKNNAATGVINLCLTYDALTTANASQVSDEEALGLISTITGALSGEDECTSGFLGSTTVAFVKIEQDGYNIFADDANDARTAVARDLFKDTCTITVSSTVDATDPTLRDVTIHLDPDKNKAPADCDDS